MRVGILDLAPVWREETADKLLPLVTGERQARIQKAARWEDRLRSLAGEYLLEKMLAQECAKAGEGQISFPLRFRYQSQGKPELADFPQRHFSVSHSEKRVSCVLAECAVGLDVQKHAGIREKISRRCYTPTEQSCWQTATAPENAFYQFWSLKEAFAKLLGRGLSFPFEQVEFIPGPENAKGFQDFEVCTREAGAYCARTYEIGSGYTLAVCALEAEELPEQAEWFSLDLPASISH